MVNTTKNYVVELDAFQGPLDLLLDLIEQEELDITRVSLARVTDQYLQHIEALQEKDPDHIVDFLVLASQLMVIKSKALLPFLVLEEEEELDARELEFRLKQLKIFREYSEKLESKLADKTFLFEKRFFVNEDTVHFTPPPAFTSDMFARAMEFLVKALPQEEFLEEEHIQDTVSTKDKILVIQKNLKRLTKMNFNELVADRKSKMEVVITFLAMLELLKQRMIQVEQSDLFGDITLHHNPANT